MSLLSRAFGKPDTTSIPYRLNSPEGLALRWLQWAASSKTACNPIADTTGMYADVEQPEDVWFLAGCFGGEVMRRCTIPANKKLFFPVFNFWMTENYEAPDLSKSYGYLNIDGEEIELDSIHTTRKTVIKGVWDNPVTGTIFGLPMFICGFWKLVEPLSIGQHEIYFRGGDGQGFHLEVAYHISIVSD